MAFGTDTIEKLKILSQDSQYDLACACGTNQHDHRRRSSEGKWLYPVTLPSGGKSVMLKTLLSNVCVNDCKYCPLRSHSNVHRCSLGADETATAFMEYFKRSDVFGLFLSSGVSGTPDQSMERLVAVAEILRRRHAFRGYIHLKVLPGASDSAVERAVAVSSAVSLNIETPGESHFTKLSTSKRYLEDIIHPLRLISHLTEKGQPRSKVKCTTQFVVGASDETDREIVKYIFAIYNRLKFDRVYFSAYQQGLGSPEIPGEGLLSATPAERLNREHRLYQVDFLVRKYGFAEGDILYASDGNLSLDKDPKEAWAMLHPEFFPVNINTADREALLRAPGLGPTTVDRILKRRKQGRIDGLAAVGVKGIRLSKASRYLVF